MSVNYEIYLNRSAGLRDLADELVQRLQDEGEAVAPPALGPHGHYSSGTDLLGIVVRWPHKIKLEVLGETYGIRANLMVSVQAYSAAEYPKPQASLMRLADALLREDGSDFLMEFNGEFMIVLRKAGEVQINHAFDDGSRFPFHVLTVPHKIVHVPM